MYYVLPGEEQKVWKIQLILEPVGNGGPAVGGKDGVWEKGDGLHPME